MCTGQRELLDFNMCGRRIRDFCVCVLRYKWEVKLCAHSTQGMGTVHHQFTWSWTFWLEW